MINVQRLRAVAAETLKIVAAGGYDDPSGARVDMNAQIGAAVTGTRLHPPTEQVHPLGARNPSPVIELVNATTLEAGGRLAPDAAVLVFASARTPGGGFLSGATRDAADERMRRCGGRGATMAGGVAAGTSGPGRPAAGLRVPPDV